MKKSISILVLLLAAVFALTFVLSGCDLLNGTHTTHSYDEEWKYDNDNHWHKCKFCEEKTSESAHVYDEWVVDTDPTETTEGTRHRDCLICDYVEEGTIDPLGQGGHKHVYDDEWKFDEDEHWHKCLFCEETTDNTAHVYDEWVTDKTPTVTEDGSRHRDCLTCDYFQTDTIDALGEDHKHVYDKCVSDGDLTHHLECICGERSTEPSQKHTLSDWVVEREATTKQEGSQYRTCSQCGYMERQSIPIIVIPDRIVNFYAINDFHGEWSKMSQVSGYLSMHKADGNTLLINSGDMFQGSMESNSNYGALLAECMDDTGFDSFTYGNHEFDWGLDNLRKLASNSQTPYLGANIYNWDRARGWGTFASDLAQEYVIRELDNGLKVGIIGVIGKDQITSISSQLVQTIGFKDPKDVVPALSQKLRNELGCDVVIVSAHTGPETFLEDYSWDITNYADAVFCAHTHKEETHEKNGVPFIQGGSYGNYVSHVVLTVDGEGNVSLTLSSNDSYSAYWPNKVNVQEKIDNSNASIADEASQVLATSNGSLSSNKGMPRLVAHAIAEYATANYPQYPIELAMVNNARSSLSAGNITYTRLYEAIPFDNVVYIAKVSGKDLLAEAGYSSNYIWRVTGNAIENSSTSYYYIAVIDYLLYHQNANRNYNYFPSAFTSGFDPVPLTKQGVEMYNYRLITRDFLLAKGSITASDYTNVNEHTDSSLLTQTVTLSLANYATQIICFEPSKFTFAY